MCDWRVWFVIDVWSVQLVRVKCVIGEDEV